MIFYKATKYKILDYCLNVFFSSLFKHFKKIKIYDMRVSEIRCGRFFKRIEFKSLEIWWEDVEIMNIQISDSCYWITFSYSNTNCENKDNPQNFPFNGKTFISIYE